MAGDSENARRRPEDIVADSFLDHVPASATEAWSVRSRRTILVAMAVAGAVMVSAGLVITGGLAPGPGRSHPVQSSTDASVLARSLLRPLTEEQPATPPSAPAGLLPTPATTSPPARAGTAVVPSSAEPATAPQPTTPSGSTSSSLPPPATTSTTRPCPLVSQRVGTGVQLPPLCP